MDLSARGERETMKTIPFTDLIQNIPGLLGADSAIHEKERDSPSHADDDHWTFHSCLSNDHRLLMSHSLTSLCRSLEKLDHSFSQIASSILACERSPLFIEFDQPSRSVESSVGR
jgi:hypothetical protein